MWSVALAAPERRGPATVGTAALRTILAGYLGVAPERVPLTRARGGKPRLEGLDLPAFNVSHSGSLAVVAVTARVRVGVDIERCSGRARDGLLERILSPAQAAAVRALPTAERELALLGHWTAKEAFLKALGVGLGAADDLRDVGTAAACEARGLTLQRFDPREGYVGTVAASGGSWRAVGLEFEPASHFG